MADVLRVYAIDDDPLILEVLREILEPGCVVETFGSVEACVPRLEDAKPDMFLLDVGLPGMDGYGFCRLIKDDESLRHIPVTFVSSHDTIDDRLKGYDAGGEDFIVKPFAPEEVQRKIKVAQQIILGKASLADQAKAANSFSMMVMASMGETGIVMQLLGKLFACDSELEVAAALLELLQGYQLDGVAQTRVGQRTLTLSPAGANLPLEVSVLSHVRSQGRIFEFRNRGAYNCEHVTLMVNNMPVNNTDLCGRLRDHLSLAAQGAESRLKAIETEETNQRTRTGIDEALQSIRDALGPMSRAHGEERVASAQLLHDFEHKLAATFANLGLTGAQEHRLEDVVSEYMSSMTALQERSGNVYQILQRLNEKLEQLQ